jgi:hypothetical protein
MGDNNLFMCDTYNLSPSCFSYKHPPAFACFPYVSPPLRDPFRMGDNILVMCDTYEPPRVAPDGTVEAPKPIPTNTRFSCAAVMEKAKDEEPW